MKFHDIWNNICAHHGLDPHQFKVEFQYESAEECAQRLLENDINILSALATGEMPEGGVQRPVGRATECRIIEGDEVIVRQHSFCHTDADTFVRTEGRRIAFARAYEAFKELKGLERQTVTA